MIDVNLKFATAATDQSFVCIHFVTNSWNNLVLNTLVTSAGPISSQFLSITVRDNENSFYAIESKCDFI